ncbi:MAG: hypothetical protein MUD09_06970 [Desulfobacterales bacterium]|nr:hypothetical protein [Desulfobacterales bacterium]
MHPEITRRPPDGRELDTNQKASPRGYWLELSRLCNAQESLEIIVGNFLIRKDLKSFSPQKIVHNLYGFYHLPTRLTPDYKMLV